jgi:hypothetical protein
LPEEGGAYNNLGSCVDEDINYCSEQGQCNCYCLSENECLKDGTSEVMNISEAIALAQSSDCVSKGVLTDETLCNSDTGNWWIDLEVDGAGDCSPACVVNVETSDVEINWRCLGVIPSTVNITEGDCIARTGEVMNLSEALDIVLDSRCLREGTISGDYSCNSVTGTWWIKLNVPDKESCNPACVVNMATREAEINWRCLGVI